MTNKGDKSPTLKNNDFTDTLNSFTHQSSKNHNTMRLKSPGNIFSNNQSINPITSLNDSSDIHPTEVADFQSTLSKNMRRLKSRQLKKKTIDHISNRRVTYSRASSIAQSTESDLRDNEAIPEINVGIIPKFDQDFGKRTEYFKKKGGNGKVIDSDKKEEGGIARGLFGLMHCCSRRD